LPQKKRPHQLPTHPQTERPLDISRGNLSMDMAPK